eukprot:PITA_20014
MMNAHWVLKYFRKMLPNWHMVLVDSLRNYGGLAALWNPRWTTFRDFRCFAGIFLIGRLKGLAGRIHIINLYVPYQDRETFWDLLDTSNILKIGSHIVAGDFNTIVSLEECWGSIHRKDQLVDRLQTIFSDNNLLEICPHSTMPTWNNGRAGSHQIGKRLDRGADYPPMKALNGKLHTLKSKSRKWERKKKKKMIKELVAIKKELEKIVMMLDDGNPSPYLIKNIKELEEKKQMILHFQEVTWQLKSRELWLKEGDRNTKFFRRYANYRRNFNTI